jgi:hypothetical protein
MEPRINLTELRQAWEPQRATTVQLTTDGKPPGPSISGAHILALIDIAEAAQAAWSTYRGDRTNRTLVGDMARLRDALARIT